MSSFITGTIGKEAIKVNELLMTPRKDTHPALSVTKDTKQGKSGLKVRTGLGALGTSGLARRQEN